MEKPAPWLRVTEGGVMRIRRVYKPEGGPIAELQGEVAGAWRRLDEPGDPVFDWLPAPTPTAPPMAGALALPFQPRSFRDCSLYEMHWMQASRGYAKRFLPGAYRIAKLYERVTRRTFPKFRPDPLAYKQPVYYFGNHLTFIPSGTPFQLPSISDAVDYELELGAVLRAPLRNASPEEAIDAIGGFVVVNDWSCRDLQRPEMATGLGPQKSKHFCSSMSAEMVEAADILPRIERLEGAVEINGKLIARVSTAGMLHNWGKTLSWLSRDETLQPGELIATGTIPNGCSMENGYWLSAGDTLRLVIDGVGEIRHDIRG